MRYFVFSFSFACPRLKFSFSLNLRYIWKKRYKALSIFFCKKWYIKPTLN